MLDAWVQLMPEPAQRFLHGGYVAVGTFFVLSGFVLARSYCSTIWTRRTLFRYVVARYARTYPVYLLSLLVLAPIIYSDRMTTDSDVLVSYGLVLQGWTVNPPVQWNTPAWSLSCELFFYVLFPLFIIPLRNVRWPLLLAVAAFTTALPASLARAGVPPDWKPVLHLADFILGIACSGLYTALAQSRSRLMGRGYWLYVPAALLGVVVVISGSNLLLLPVNALLLVGLALGGGMAADALSTRRALLLGRASYSMYILHIPFLWWYKRTWLYTWERISHPVSALIYVAGTILVSIEVWRRVEEPANRAIRNRISGLRAPLIPRAEIPEARSS